jgi:hypothetical protein
MRQILIRAVWLTALCLGTLVCTVEAGIAQFPAVPASSQLAFEMPSRPPLSQEQIEQILQQRQRPLPPPASATPVAASRACALRPLPTSKPPKAAAIDPVTLERFRVLRSDSPTESDAAKTGENYQPREVVALANFSNFGDRYWLDVNGKRANLTPLVVLHETVGSASSAINLFLNYHPNDADQASYHTLIQRNGTVVYIVPPDKRAFGAGNSIFMGSNGLETVQTKANFPPSVNNFAYHVSLETPRDGNHNGYTHSGYTAAQYRSLAWVVAKTGVDPMRITTHKAVDRSQSRLDPRSFNTTEFLRLLSTYPRTTEIPIGCTDPTQPAAPE